MHKHARLLAALAGAAVFGFVFPAHAATSTCDVLRSPLVTKALGVPAPSISKPFDARHMGPQWQLVALKDATAAQTCVATAVPHVIEMRATIVNYPTPADATNAVELSANEIKQMVSDNSAALGITYSGHRETVAGLHVIIGTTEAQGPPGHEMKIYTYTIGAQRGSTTYTLSGQSENPIDESAMKSLYAQLVK